MLTETKTSLENGPKFKTFNGNTYEEECRLPVHVLAQIKIDSHFFTFEALFVPFFSIEGSSDRRPTKWPNEDTNERTFDGEGSGATELSFLSGRGALTHPPIAQRHHWAHKFDELEELNF